MNWVVGVEVDLLIMNLCITFLCKHIRIKFQRERIKLYLPFDVAYFVNILFLFYAF